MKYVIYLDDKEFLFNFWLYNKEMYGHYDTMTKFMKIIVVGFVADDVRDLNLIDHG